MRGARALRRVIRLSGVARSATTIRTGLISDAASLNGGFSDARGARTLVPHVQDCVLPLHPRLTRRAGGAYRRRAAPWARSRRALAGVPGLAHCWSAAAALT